MRNLFKRSLLPDGHLSVELNKIYKLSAGFILSLSAYIAIGYLSFVVTVPGSETKVSHWVENNDPDLGVVSAHMARSQAMLVR